MTYQRPQISTFAIMNCPKLIRFKSHGIHQISAVSPICDISKPSLRNPNFYSSIYAHHCRISIRRAITNKIGRGTEGFYQNQQVEQYAAVKTKKVTLFQLLAFGRHMTELKLIKSANYVRQELAVRIGNALPQIRCWTFLLHFFLILLFKLLLLMLFYLIE
jgi:hypothetical protein